MRLLSVATDPGGSTDITFAGHSFRNTNGTVNLDYVKAVFDAAVGRITVRAQREATELERAREVERLSKEFEDAKRKVDDVEEELADLEERIAKSSGAKLEGLRQKKKDTNVRARKSTDAHKKLNDSLYNLTKGKRALKMNVTPRVSLSYREHPLGTLCRVRQVSRIQISPAEQRRILIAALDGLDEELQRVAFEGVGDDGAPFTAVDPGSGETRRILGQLARLGMADLAVIGNNEEEPSTVRWNAITALGLWPAPSGERARPTWTSDGWDLPYFHLWAETGESDMWRVWIPRRLMDIVFDLADDAYWYEGTTPTIDRDRRLATGQFACYALNGTALSCARVVGARPKSGAGGGAMRADRVDEADYAWKGDGALAHALGFEMKRQVTAAPAGYTVYRGLPGFEYYKSFATRPDTKKNLPHDTVPLNLGDLDKKARDFYAAGLIKKKKGDWNRGGVAFSGRAGERLMHKNTERDQAGAVMKRAFSDLGLDGGAVNLGSATAFAKFVVEKDRAASDFLAGASRALAKWGDAKVDLKVAGMSIRTDQEWCHLFGHGDGGAEELANFVSGSKHCNTTQLAIESGQRYKKHPDLSVLITAYLLPNDGLTGLTGRAKPYSSEDEAYLRQFRSGTVTTRTSGGIGMMRELLASFAKRDTLSAEARRRLREDFQSILPARSGALVPSEKAYRDASTKLKERFLRDACVRFKTILDLPLPLGWYVRYKVMDGGDKVFEHVFSAQLEHFDYNEYQLLQHAVKLAIAKSKGGEAVTDLVEEVNGKIDRRRKREDDTSLPAPNYKAP